MQSWVWRQLHVALPEDWELLQYSRNPESGRCVFADRYQFRFEIDWRQVEGKPDFERMLSDYKARLEEDGLEQIASRQCAGWPGVCAVMPDGRATNRYGSYFESLGCLVEIVFLWPKRRHRETEVDILSSVHAEPANEQGQARWKAFGMDLYTGAAFEFERCDAEPAHAHFCFTSEHGRLWDHFNRRGLVKQWLDCSLEEWHQDQIPKGYTLTRARQHASGDHLVSRIQARKSHPALLDMLFGRRQFVAASWLCPRDGRLYSASRQAPARSGLRVAERPPPSLSCCSDLEVAL